MNVTDRSHRGGNEQVSQKPVKVSVHSMCFRRRPKAGQKPIMNLNLSLAIFPSVEVIATTSWSISALPRADFG